MNQILQKNAPDVLAASVHKTQTIICEREKCKPAVPKGRGVEKRKRNSAPFRKQLLPYSRCSDDFEVLRILKTYIITKEVIWYV